MKISVFNGSPKGKSSNTYAIACKVIEKLKKMEDVEIIEFSADDNFPPQCKGCGSCFLKGKEKCPHYEITSKIEEALLRSDASMFLTPVFVLSISGQMKSLLDHFGYLFVVHRPREEFIKKTSLIISSTVGAGTKQAMKQIELSLKYWGIPKIQKLGIALMEMSYSKMSDKRKRMYDKKIDKAANKFYKHIKRRQRQRKSVFFRIMFLVSKVIIKKYDDNPDKDYWREKGWIK